MMRRISLLILFITISFSAMGVFAFPVQTLAAEPAKPAEKACRCYCASKGDGAVDSGMLNATKCTEQCAKKKQAVAVCASEFGDYPSSNLLCFTDKQCKLQKGVLDKTQQPECLKGEKWCYPDPAQQAKVKLQLSIAGMTEVSNLGDYLNSFYKWMLNSGIIIAIIFVMIGGLQYVLAAGGGDVSKAKTRIKNAVIGLALLIFSYLILFTVNPYLVRLQIPQLPMVRKVSLGDNKSCEAMKSEYNLVDKEGKDITGSTLAGKKCGDSALVKDKKDGGSVAAGITCNFDKCNKPNEKCLGVGKDAKCLACESVTFEDEKHPPSSATCNSLKLDDDKKKKIKNYCFYSHDPSVTVQAKDEVITALATAGTALISGPGAIAVGGVLTASLLDDMRIGTCAAMPVDCKKIKECGNYKDVVATSDIVSDHMGGFFKSSSWGDMNLPKLCVENPCSKAAFGDLETNCVFNPATSNCVSTGGFVGKSAPVGVCAGKTCSGSKHCVQDGANAKCVECNEVTKNIVGMLGVKDITPSESVCNQMSDDSGPCQFFSINGALSSSSECKKITCSDIKDCTSYNAFKSSVKADASQVEGICVSDICKKSPTPGKCDFAGLFCVNPPGKETDALEKAAEEAEKKAEAEKEYAEWLKKNQHWIKFCKPEDSGKDIMTGDGKSHTCP